ncbi:hypothetical protein CSPX01_09178 [Colletotrichum filicis]|nr:hypothetical protein CSPX01_09178 [Colletotrichum filicis]
MCGGRHQTPLSLSCSCLIDCQASNQAGVETRPNWFAREALFTHLQYLHKGASTRDGWRVTYPTTKLSTRHPQALPAFDRQLSHRLLQGNSTLKCGGAANRATSGPFFQLINIINNKYFYLLKILYIKSVLVIF